MRGLDLRGIRVHRRAGGGPTGCTGRGRLRGGAVGVSFLRDYRGNGVLKNKLLLIIGLKHQGIFVETLDAAGELDTAHEVNRENNLVLAGVVQKTILDILRWLIHGRSPQPISGSKTV